MVKGLPFSSLFYTTNSAQDTPPPSPPPAAAPPAWMWPSCKHPRTQSFRTTTPSATAKTIASLFLDSGGESSFANSSARRADDCASDDDDDDSPSTGESEGGASADDMADAIVRGLRSDDRLLFEPHAPSSSILERKPPPAAAAAAGSNGKAAESSFGDGDGVAVAFDSADPYRDFRASMEEMVSAHGGVGDWEWLERMLAWYLGANGRDTHPAIVTAFVDLVVSMAAAAASTSRASSFTLAGSEPGESSSAGGHFSYGGLR
ncbi:unnamed protein product [Urochloa decumbens]|uniref:Transcription repressor n=1 Tax=Urochloa decumbens TaxID=240449 RepID=A0ABC8VPZ4_9POAL